MTTDRLRCPNSATRTNRSNSRFAWWILLIVGISMMTPVDRIACASPVVAETEDDQDGNESKKDDQTDQSSDSSDAQPAENKYTKYDALLAGVAIFVLSIFVGFEVITKVPPTLHTPLMSGSNAISGVTVVGAMIVAGHNSFFAVTLGTLAVIFAMVNVVGGFLVTHRMLSMFRR